MQKTDARTANPEISLSAARLSLAAGATAVILLAALHLLSPEVDPSWRMVSEYALGGFGWVLSSMFFAWAASCLSLFFAIRSHIRTTGGKIGMGFLLAAVAGMSMAAVFDIRHDLHGLSAMIGNPSFLIATALISGSLLHNPDWRSARGPLVWTASLCWVSFVLLIAALFIGLSRSGGQFGPGVLVGWPNRLLIVSSCAWTMVAAWRTIQIER